MALAITNVQQETVFANRDGLDQIATVQQCARMTAQGMDHVSATVPAHAILDGKDPMIVHVCLEFDIFDCIFSCYVGV